MSNANSTNRELHLPYFLVRDDRRCSTKNGHGCGKTISQLIEESNFLFQMKNKERTLPVIVLDRIDGTNEHKFDIYDSELMSKYQILCWSCHKKKHPFKLDTSETNGKSITREKSDSLRFNQKYHRELHNYLLDNSHICYGEMIIAGKKLSGGANQVTCTRYFLDEKRTKANDSGRYQVFPYECGSDDCNSNHVCLVGAKPEKLLEEEKNHLISDWKSKYGSVGKEEWGRHTSRSMTSWMDEEEYIETHCILLKHDFY